MTRNVAQQSQTALLCFEKEAEGLSASQVAAAVCQLIARDNGFSAATLDAAG